MTTLAPATTPSPTTSHVGGVSLSGVGVAEPKCVAEFVQAIQKLVGIAREVGVTRQMPRIWDVHLVGCWGAGLIRHGASRGEAG